MKTVEGCVMLGSEILADFFFVVAIISLLSGYPWISLMSFLAALYFAVGIVIIIKGGFRNDGNSDR